MQLDQINPYVSKVMPSAMRKFDHDISADKKIIKLTLGEPNFNVPEHIKQAAIEAINHNESHYPYYWGYQPLREAASNYYQEKFGYDYPAEKILVTVGATEAVASTIKALFKPGDAVIIPTPAYPLYNALTTLNELHTILVDISDDGFVLTPEKVQQAVSAHPDWDVKGLILTDPNNPTGVAYTEDQLKALVPVLKEQGIWVISDEIYGELTYGQKHYTISKWLPDQTIIVNGLSKSHAMTGYRLGLVFGPAGFMDEIAKVHQYTVTAAASIVQYATIEALTNGQDDSKPMLQAYQKRRDFVAKEMAEAGFDVVHPGGAFYVFAKIPTALHMNSWDFVNTLAKDYHIGLMPGDPFGDNHYVRISYAASDEALSVAMKAVKQLVVDHSTPTAE